MTKIYSDELQNFIDENKLLTTSSSSKSSLMTKLFNKVWSLRGTKAWKFLQPAKKMYHIGLDFNNTYKEAGLKAAFMNLGSMKRKTHKLVDKLMFDEDSYQLQKKETFDRDIKFSILVPLYNTPEKYLKDMINSVERQTYSNWQLCLADASDTEHAYVGEICLEYAQNDNRISYRKLDENKGISGNTNEAINMSEGDFIALFDHDDILCPNALFENMKVICEKDADFVYSDEVTFLEDNIYDIASYHYKPDFAIDNLRANNYICHFSTFKKSLLDQVGYFDSECDGSQDHDLILRLTSKAQRVEHIPKIIYFWRSHKNSVAQSISSKTYAIDAGIRAVKKHLDSIGLLGEVESSPVFPAIYRIKYGIIGQPMVSIVIASKDDINSLVKCIDSILKKSTYENYEVIVVDYGTEDITLLKYYSLIDKCDRVKVVRCDVNSKINALDFGVQNSRGEYVLFVDPNLSVYGESWIEELLMYSQREDVGAIGSKIYYDENRVRECGLIVAAGKDRIVLRSHDGVNRAQGGYMGRLFYAQNVSAVSSNCMMIKKEKYLQVGGFDENYIYNYYDIDLCLELQEMGYHIVVNPFSEMIINSNIHEEFDENDEKKIQRKWFDKMIKEDKYYNRNLSKYRSWNR